MVQLADLFSVPEISLLCNVAEYFQQQRLNYHPEILFSDVKVCDLIHSMAETSFKIDLFFDYSVQ